MVSPTNHPPPVADVDQERRYKNESEGERERDERDQAEVHVANLTPPPRAVERVDASLETRLDRWRHRNATVTGYAFNGPPRVVARTRPRRRDAMNAKTRRRLRQRRYDTGPHRKIRKGLAPLVAAGLATCARCGEPIEPGSKWDLGHTDDGPGYSGPEHTYCNQTAPHINNTSRRW